MKTNSTLLTIGLIILTTLLAHAQVSEKWRLPDSPTGKRATAFLEAVDRRDEAFTRSFLQENLSTEFLSAFPMEEHINVFAGISQEMGKIELVGVKKSSPYSVVLIIQSQNSGAQLQANLDLSPEPPHKINSILVESVQQNSNFKSIAELEKFLTDAEAKNLFSGAVLIAKDGKPLFKKAYGLASKRFSVPNQVDTKFNIGSINKKFTAVAINQLANQGKLSPDDVIGKYLSEFPEEIASKVTIRQLLQHKSGMGDYFGSEEYQRNFPTLRTVNDFLNLIKDEPLEFEPGTRQRYSNSGYVVLGAIIEKVSGQDYYDYIREHVCLPAGMNNTDWYEMDRPVPNLAFGYTNHNPDGSTGEGYQRNTNYTALKGSPAGGGYSTLDDLLKFDQALKSGILLGKDAKSANPISMESGLGIAGGAPGCNAILESDWERGYTVIVLSNYDPPFAEELGLEIMDSIRSGELALQ